MSKITKDKNIILTGAAINKQLQQRANNATSQMYPPKVGNLIPGRPASHSSAKTRYTTKTTFKTRTSAATHTTTPPGNRRKRIPRTGHSVSGRQMLNDASKVSRISKANIKTNRQSKTDRPRC